MDVLVVVVVDWFGGSDIDVGGILKLFGGAGEFDDRTGFDLDVGDVLAPNSARNGVLGAG